jgi:excisionase family DNA binding protein
MSPYQKHLSTPKSRRHRSDRRTTAHGSTASSGGPETGQTNRVRGLADSTSSGASQGPDLLTVPEVALYLRISRNLAYALVARNDIPSLHLGRLIRVPRRELDEWVASEATDAGAAGLSSKGSSPKWLRRGIR